MQYVHVNLGILSITCAIISAKWSMELGFGQLSQLLWGIAGLFLGPLALLILYVRQIRARQVNGMAGGNWIAGKSDSKDVDSDSHIPVPSKNI